MSDYDAIVIGSGPNGLICALTLARAGWRILVLERASEVGGGMRTGEVARAGFLHDLYSSNLGRFSQSPLYNEMQAEFDALGVRFLTSDFPFASVFPGGKAVCAYKDTDRLENELSRSPAGDLEGWRRLLDFYRRVAPKFLPLLRVTMPSSEMARQLLRIMTSPTDAARLLQIVMQTPRQFVDGAFSSPAMKGLFAPWALHSDFGPDVRGGAIVPFFFAFNSQQNGLWVAEGGAGRVSDAMRALIGKYGGTVLANAEVKKIVIRGGVAVAVETINGDSHTCSRGVIANLSPQNVFGRIISDDDLPTRFRYRVQKFRYGVGTFIVYLALSRPLQWQAGEQIASFNTVHISGDVDNLAAVYQQALQSYLPDRPLLIVNQLSATDPSRAPGGQCVVRIHSRPFPARILGDAAGKIEAHDWGDAKDSVADRLLSQLAEYAPNIRTDLLARHVVSPLDLERDNPNWVGGDCGSGSNHLSQNYFRRPFPGWSRYKMPIGNLYMIGSSTWPSGGTHGMSGFLLARKLLEKS